MNSDPCDPNSMIVVLVVDDNPNDQALFSLAVEHASAPFWVLNVHDGRQAIDCLSGTGVFRDRAMYPMPDLVLLDLKTGRDDSFEFLDWRRRHKERSLPPVILLTGSLYEPDIRRALDMGAAAHVSKPLAFKDLIDAVRRIRELTKQLGVRTKAG